MLSSEDFGDLTGAGGCNIERTEERAISMAQLNLLVEHARRRLKVRPFSVDRPAADGKWTKESLTSVDEMSLYDMNSNVILPATSEKRCSMVELLAKEVQRPDYFVSLQL